MKKVFIWVAALLCTLYQGYGQSRFKVLVMYENGGHHLAYSNTARVWLNKLARDSNFTVNYVQSTDQIDQNFLSAYQLIIQLDYAPYGWKDKAAAAFQNYISEGKGGWIGFHHATLLGGLMVTRCGNGIRILWAALSLKAIYPGLHRQL